MTGVRLEPRLVIRCREANGGWPPSPEGRVNLGLRKL